MLLLLEKEKQNFPFKRVTLSTEIYLFLLKKFFAGFFVFLRYSQGVNMVMISYNGPQKCKRCANMCFHTTSAFGEGEGKKLFITQHLSVPLFYSILLRTKKLQ